MKKTFEEVLREQLRLRGDRRGRRERRILRLLDSPPSRWRTRAIARLERHARVHLEGEGYAVGSDWGALADRDWAGFFEGLLAFLSAILPMILPFLLKPARRAAGKKKPAAKPRR